MEASTTTAPSTSGNAPTIVRLAKRRSYLVVDKRTITDPRLSLRARGLLAYLLSKPDDWTIDSTKIADEVKEGRDAVRTAAAELEAAGYLERRRRQVARGRWITEIYIYEEPKTGFQASANQSSARPAETSTEDGIPGVGQPTVGEPGVKTQITETEEPLAVDEPPAAEEAPPKKPRKRAPDVVWDALIACGIPPPETRSERGRWNRAVKELKEVDATPGEIRTRARRYKQRWPGADLTPTALTANWSMLTEQAGAYAHHAGAAPITDIPRCGHGYPIVEDADGLSSPCTKCDRIALERAANDHRHADERRSA